MTNEPTLNKQASKELTMAHIVYLLQAIGFFFPITLIAAVIIDYIKKDDVTEPWLASHYRWQIQTFWYGLIFAMIGAVLVLLLVGYIILLGVMIWMVYRVVKGWMRLSEHRGVTDATI